MDLLRSRHIFAFMLVVIILFTLDNREYKASAKSHGAEEPPSSEMPPIRDEVGFFQLLISK